MIPEFNTFAGNKILKWHLMNPDSRLHINELARELGISPSTVLRYANLFQKAGIVTIHRIGTAHQIILNNEKPLVKELKKCAILLLLNEYGIEEIAREISEEFSGEGSGEISEEFFGDDSGEREKRYC